MPRPRAGRPLTDERAVAREFLTRHLRGGWFHPAAALQEQAAAEGIHVRTLRRAAADLGVELKREKRPGAPGTRVMWRLPAR